jgi:hypothetical protein
LALPIRVSIQAATQQNANPIAGANADSSPGRTRLGPKAERNADPGDQDYGEGARSGVGERGAREHGCLAHRQRAEAVDQTAGEVLGHARRGGAIPKAAVMKMAAGTSTSV